MAVKKKIPKKKIAVAKKKHKLVKHKSAISKAYIEKHIALFEKESARRHKIALAAYNLQDKKTKLVIDALLDKIQEMARQSPSYIKKGDERVEVQIKAEVRHSNYLYMAMKMLKDLAVMDIQIENYKLPDNRCVECEVKL